MKICSEIRNFYLRHSYRRLIDLRKHSSKPLVIQRAEKMQRKNLLQLKKKSVRETTSGQSRKFDLQKRQRISNKNEIYLLANKSSPQKISRFKMVMGAIVLVFFLNLIGILGSGKQTFEKTVESAFAGIGDLLIAVENFTNGDFIASQNQFSHAVKILDKVEKDLMVLGGAGAILETQPENVQAGSRLVSAGKLLASSGEHLAEAANKISFALKTWNVRQQAVAANHSVESFSDQLNLPITKILKGLSEIENANAILKLVETNSLPTKLQKKVQEAKNELNYFLEIMRPITAALPEIPNLLGDKIPRRYLILFQNQDEIRPTGGFIGSVGILDLNDGFATKFEIRDVYSIDGQLTKHLDPPEGFGFITGNWGLRDSNYHPDFPTSAETASLIFETAGFGSVDGVIAINASLLEKIAAIVGGIKLERFEKKIAAEDLNLLLELVIESKTDGVENPKQILSEVWKVLSKELRKLSTQDLLEIIFYAMREKEVQFASENSDLMQIAKATGVANELQETENDYLFVVNTSLSGNKSDRFCENQITHISEISENGEVINELKILRKHDWGSAAEKKVDQLARDFGIQLPQELKEILGRGRNIDLIKVFVPFGSELTSVEGVPLERVETKKSAGKTYFMFSLTTQPKFSREVILKYRLPMKFEKEYSFLGEFQSGDRTRKIEKIVEKGGVEILSKEVILGKEITWQFGR